MYESNYTVLRQIKASSATCHSTAARTAALIWMGIKKYGIPRSPASTRYRFGKTARPAMMGAIPCSHSPHLFSFPHKAPVDHAVRSLWHMAAGLKAVPAVKACMSPASLRAPDSTPRSSLTASNPIPAGMRCTTCSVRSVFCAPAATSWVSRIRSPSWGSPQAVC